MKLKGKFPDFTTFDISHNFFMQIGWGLLILTFVLIGCARPWATFDQDELEAIHSAWKIMQGAEIYRDFFQHHHPFFYYLIIPFIKFFGETLNAMLAIRYLVFFQYILIGLVTYIFAKRLFNKESSLIALYLLLFAPIFMKILEIRPDGAQTLWSMLALFFLCRFLDLHFLRDLILSAVCLSISFLFLQKAIFLTVLIGCVLLYYWYYGICSFKELIIYAVIWALPIIVYVGYLSSVGAFDFYVKFNWLLNMLHPAVFHSIHTLKILMYYSQFLCAFYVIGLLYNTKVERYRLIAFLSLGLLFAATFLVKFSYTHYYAPALPLMAMIAGHSIYHVLQSRIKMLIIMITIAAGPFLTYSFEIAKFFIKGIKNEQHEKFVYVLSVAKPGDYVYDGKSFFNVFRQDIDFFWFEARMNHEKSDLIPIYERLTGNRYDLYKDIEKYKPTLISTYYVDLENPVIKQHYIRSALYDDLLLRI